MYEENEDEEDLREYSVIKMQSIARLFLARSRLLKKIYERYEKIRDPRRDRYYYYDKELDTSSWRKPRLLLDGDLPTVAPTYTNDEASTKIQTRIRMVLALLKVRLLYQSTIISSFDEASGAYYYYNPKSEATMWDLPTFMNNRMDYAKKKPKPQKIARKPKKKVQEQEEEEVAVEEDGDSATADPEPAADEATNEEAPDDDHSEAGSEESLDSAEIRERRRQNRRFPRSKVQAIVDQGEDNIPETVELDLSGIGASRFTSRLYDLVELQKLCLAKNKLTRVSKDIQYLVNLTQLDISYNRISSIPGEIEELKLLTSVDMSHNKLVTFPGQFWKLANVTHLNLSHNNFLSIPVETGNLELLKELGVWDVGIGLMNKLTFLDASHNRLVDWPIQLEQLMLLTHLNLSHNRIDAVPNVIGPLKALECLDLSHNTLTTIAPELYGLTSLKTLFLHENRLQDLPILKEHHIDDGPRPEYLLSQLTELSLHHNALSYLDERLAIFAAAERLDLSHNKIISIAGDALSVLTSLQWANFSHNSLVDVPMGMGACSLLTEVDISYNLLREMPPCFIKLVKLVSINLSHNQMTEVSGKIFAMLNDLERLEIQWNQLTALPPLLYTLKKVTHLDVSHNAISGPIHDTMGHLVSATYINMSHNQIVSLPESISEITRLEVLELKNNQLTVLPSSLSMLKHLRRVTLSKNDLQKSPQLLSILPHLISSNLSWNCNMQGCQNIDWSKLTEQFNSKQATEFITLPVLTRKLHALVTEVDRLSDQREAKQRIDAQLPKDKKNAIYLFEVSAEERAKYYAEHGGGPAAEEEDELSAFSKGTVAPKTVPTASAAGTGKKKEKGPKKEKKSKVKKASSLTVRTLAWHQKLRQYFGEHFITGDTTATSAAVAASPSTTTLTEAQANLKAALAMDPLKMTDRLEAGVQLSRAEVRCALHLSSVLQSLDRYRGYPAKLGDFIVRSDSGTSDSASTIDMAIIEAALDNGSEYQEAIEGYQLLLHEVNALAILQNMRHMMENPLPEPEDEENMPTDETTAAVDVSVDVKRSGSPLRLLGGASARKSTRSPSPSKNSAAASVSSAATSSKPSKANRKSSKVVKPATRKQLMAMAFGEESVEERIKAVGKSVLVKNFQSSIPSILHYPRILVNESSPTGLHDTSRDRMLSLVFTTYVDFCKVLLKRAAAIAQSIRRIERRGSVRVSCLDFAQREGCDFLDLMLDVYEQLVKSIVDKEVAGERQSLAQRKKNNVATILSALTVEVPGDGATEEDHEEGGGGVTGHEGSSEHGGDGEGAAEGIAEGGGVTESTEAANETVNPSHKKSTKTTASTTAATAADVPADSTKRAPPAAAPPAPPVKLSASLPSMDPQNLIILDPIATSTAAACITFLSAHRSLTLAWAFHCTEVATSILKLNDYDLDSTVFRMHGTHQYSGLPAWLREGAIKLCTVKSRVFAGLQLYDKAVDQYRKLMRLTKRNDIKWILIEMVKLHIAQGNYVIAQEQMMNIIERFIMKPLKKIVVPDVIELLRIDKEIGLLYQCIEVQVGLLKGQHQLFKHEQHRVFSVKPNGLLHKNCDATFPEIKYGRNLRDKKTLEKRELKKAADKKDLELYESRRTFKAFVDDEKAKVLHALSMFDLL